MQQSSAMETRRFLLTGGSGLVGQAISREILDRGLGLLQASRHRPGQEADGSGGAGERLAWSPGSVPAFAEPERLEGLWGAIHLSGANLAARRWSPAYKREIVTSRTRTTAALAESLAALRRPPRVLITASATGIYGNRGDEVLTERSARGTDFLAETCEAWEQAAQPAVEAGIRVVHLRLGVVLTPAGGALAKVLPLFRVGLGGRLGSGKQWMSWVALDDVPRAVLHLSGVSNDPTLEATLEGPVNCVAPAPVTNADYTRALGRALHRPALVAAPAFALRAALGEMADAALLASCRAVPERLLASGFRFEQPDIDAALKHLLGR